MLTDAMIIALVPGLVEVAKRTGLPSRYGAVAALFLAISIVVLSHAAANPGPVDGQVLAGLFLTGVVDGLAAIGLYRLVPRSDQARV